MAPNKTRSQAQMIRAWKGGNRGGEPKIELKETAESGKKASRQADRIKRLKSAKRGLLPAPEKTLRIVLLHSKP